MCGFSSSCEHGVVGVRSVSGQTWPQDPYRPIRLDKWCRPNLAYTQKTGRDMFGYTIKTEITNAKIHELCVVAAHRPRRGLGSCPLPNPLVGGLTPPKPPTTCGGVVDGRQLPELMYMCKKTGWADVEPFPYRNLPKLGSKVTPLLKLAFSTFWTP